MAIVKVTAAASSSVSSSSLSSAAGMVGFSGAALVTDVAFGSGAELGASEIIFYFDNQIFQWNGKTKN